MLGGTLPLMCMCMNACGGSSNASYQAQEAWLLLHMSICKSMCGIHRFCWKPHMAAFKANDDIAASQGCCFARSSVCHLNHVHIASKSAQQRQSLCYKKGFKKVVAGSGSRTHCSTEDAVCPLGYRAAHMGHQCTLPDPAASRTCPQESSHQGCLIRRTIRGPGSAGA